MLAPAAVAGAALAQPAPLTYPRTATVPQVDDYHGTRVADPFRWLEDDTASAVKAWVRAQNAVTFGHLATIPYRGALLARLRQLQDYPRETAPLRDRGWVLYSRNSGLQNQGVYYIQRGLRGTPAVLIDPNALSKDGTTRVEGFAFNRTGTRLAYLRSEAGSDWQEIRVMDPATRRHLPDRIRWVKVSGIAWHGDGFYYSRYPTPADTLSALSSRNEDHRVYFHRLGTPQEADRLVYADAAHPARFHLAEVTHDQRFLVLSIADRGEGFDGNQLWVRDLAATDTTWHRLGRGFDKELALLDNDGGALLVLTTEGAPNRRVVRIDPRRPDPAHWTTLVPEQPEVLETAAVAGRRVIAGYLKDVTSRLVPYRYDGTREREVELPGVGTATVVSASQRVTDVFYTFTSFTAPPTTYRLELATGKSAVHRAVTLPFDPSAYETRQAFATSRDGTRIPLFIVARKGIARDGRRPTLVYGYGGFNISLPPAFSASRMAWLEQGGVYVQVNLRGGGEYGEAWHQAGMKERKQNVFDDFIAAAEWLVANGYTSPAQLAMQGASNGGLLVGAVMTQRPDLFRVALPAVGVMDMLRFQRFTIGWNWVADYGSSDTADGFAYLFRYSPLHNLRDGVAYPATLVTTADHDDRVVPAHSFKFAAQLQQAHRGDAPVLIRIETQSGHGSASLSKALEETADVFAFTMHHLGMRPEFPGRR
jgi:prolyl oligopeptidase